MDYLKVDFTDGVWTHCDTKYEVVDYREKTRTVVLHKTTRYGIYYTDIKVDSITRKLSKDKTIKVANHTLDLSKMNGVA